MRNMAFRENAFVFAGLCVCAVTWQALAKVDVSMEDRVEVSVGDTAEISCFYTVSEPSAVMIQWFVRAPGHQRLRIYYSDNSTETVDKATVFSGRINVSHARDSGQVLLTVYNVKVADEREFICQVNGMSVGNNEGKTRLMVFAAPEFPVIEGVYSGISVEKEEPSKIASCIARNGFPQPNITWYRDQTPLELSNVRLQVTKESTGLFTVHGDLYLKVVKEDKDALFYCEVTYLVPRATLMTESAKINISVFYPTESIEIWREYPKSLIKEGDTVEIHCRGDGNPQPVFTFYKNTEKDLESDQGLLTLRKVTRADSGTYFCRCFDQNTFDEMERNTTITVHYLDPAVVMPKDSVVIDQGESLTATCNALSSLTTSTKWFKDGEMKMEGNTLVLEDATLDTTGRYTCNVTVPSLPGLETFGSVDIFVQGPPKIREPEEMSLEESVDKFVNLTCEAHGFPLPRIDWVLSDNQSLHEVSMDVAENSASSVATVRVTSDVTASCHAKNAMGAAKKSFSIKAIPMATTAASPSTKATAIPPKRIQKEGSGVIIAVIIICILLLAILGSVLYFLYKKGKLPCGRSAKKDITPEKSNKDDIVMEMKTEEAVLLQAVNGEKKLPNDQETQ